MRPIDADALKDRCGEWYTEEGTEEGFIGTLGSLLDTAPTLDAVPVIRCTKCKYYGPGDHAGFWRCENWGVDINSQASPPETFYCADGERREE